MLPSIGDIVQGLRGDDAVAFVPYSREVKLLSHFTPDAWSLIVPHIQTEADWQAYLAEYASVCLCLLITSVASQAAVGFLLLSIVSSAPLRIGYHGGGWADSLGGVKLYYRAMSLLLAHLERHGVEVQTSCLRCNRRAYRFITSIGFEVADEDAERYYFTK